MAAKKKAKKATRKPKTDLFVVLEGKVFLEERTRRGDKLVEKHELPGEQCVQIILNAIVAATVKAVEDPEGFKKAVAKEKR